MKITHICEKKTQEFEGQLHNVRDKNLQKLETFQIDYLKEIQGF